MNKEQFEQLIEIAKTDKKGLIKLKDAAVCLGAFDLAADLRAVELKEFPESEEEKLAGKLATMFRMVELNVENRVAWLLLETVKKYIELGDNFSIEDSAKIIAKRNQIFN